MILKRVEVWPVVSKADCSQMAFGISQTMTQQQLFHSCQLSCKNFSFCAKVGFTTIDQLLADKSFSFASLV